MRKLSSKLQGILADAVIEAFYVVKIEGLYNTTSYFHDVTLSDEVLYHANGSLLKIDAPRISTTVDREQFTISLVDADFTASTFVHTGFIGKKVEVRAVLINQETGEPELNLADTLMVYKGTIDGASLVANTQEKGTMILNLILASPMADLDLRRQFFTSKDFIRNRNPNDGCCDQLYAGSNTLTLKWGKA